MTSRSRTTQRPWWTTGYTSSVTSRQAEDNPTGIDSDVSLANGDRIEIDTVPGEYTNFLEATPSGSEDWVETWGSSIPQLLWDSLTTSQFPSEVSRSPTICPLTRGPRISTRCSLPA